MRANCKSPSGRSTARDDVPNDGQSADEIVTNDPVAAAAVEQQYAELNDVELFLVRLRERLSQ